MAAIRPFALQDVAPVATLFQHSFRDRRVTTPASLERYIADLFLNHPWRDDKSASLVHVGDRGEIDGFIGALPMHMSLAGEPIRASVACSLMVKDPDRNPLVGARLLRALRSASEDLLITETAMPHTKMMWEKIGGTPVPSFSLEWVRVFRPAGAALAWASERIPLLRFLTFAALGVDRVSARLYRKIEDDHGEIEGYSDLDAEDDLLVAKLLELTQPYRLRPDWDAPVLRWILRHAAVKGTHGALRRRIVVDHKGDVVGCYLYYGQAHKVAWVLHLLAASGKTDIVVRSLFAHARAMGCVAIRGRTQPDQIDALMLNRCAFLHRSSTVVYSRDKSLLEPILAGDALLVGLAGERWTQLIRGVFI